MADYFSVLTRPGIKVHTLHRDTSTIQIIQNCNPEWCWAAYIISWFFDASVVGSKAN